MTKSLRSLLMLILLIGFAVSSAWAQEPAAAAPVTNNLTLWGMWKTGGWSMYPIGMLSVAAVALTVFGFLNCREDKMLQSALIPPIKDAVARYDYRTASAICTGTPGIMTNILHAGLNRLSPRSLDLSNMEKAMEEAAVEETTAGLKPINYISVIAQIAPMFGLLGTVSGMIKAFQKISLGMMGQAEKLAGDIGEAMITTAFGLLVGIPAMFFYFFLKNKFQTNMARVARGVGDITHDIGVSLNSLPPGGLEAALAAAEANAREAQADQAPRT